MPIAFGGTYQRGMKRQGCPLEHDKNSKRGCLIGQGWEISFCTCPTTAAMDLKDITSLTYTTFYEAAEELSRQATLEAGGAKQHPGAANGAGFRNDPMAPVDSGASAIDNAFLSLNSG